MTLTQISTAGVKDDAVTSGKIPANAVGTSEIADGAVTNAKIGSNAITNAKMANDSVSTNQIVNSSININKLGGDSVGTTQIVDDAVTNAKIADDAIDSPQIANGAVDTIHLADLNVDTAKITNNAVTTAKIADDSVTTAKINANAVTTVKINDNAVTTAKIQAANVTTAKLANGAVDYGKLADGAVLTAKIADDAVTSAKIANDAVVQAAIADDAVNEARLQVSNAPSNGYFLSAQSGNTGGLTWAEAGGGGLVKSAVRRYYGFVQYSSIGNAGFTEVSKAYVDITPTSTSNYIRLGGLLCWEGSDTEDQYSFRWKRVITGGSTTSIDSTQGAGNRVGVTYKSEGGAGGLICMQLSNIYDLPATTSSVRYYLEVFCDGANQTLYINRTHNDANDPRDERGASYFSAEEIDNSIFTFTNDT